MHPVQVGADAVWGSGWGILLFGGFWAAEKRRAHRDGGLPGFARGDGEGLAFEHRRVCRVGMLDAIWRDEEAVFPHRAVNGGEAPLPSAGQGPGGGFPRAPQIGHRGGPPAFLLLEGEGPHVECACEEWRFAKVFKAHEFHKGVRASRQKRHAQRDGEGEGSLRVGFGRGVRKCGFGSACGKICGAAAEGPQQDGPGASCIVAAEGDIGEAGRVDPLVEVVVLRREQGAKAADRLAVRKGDLACHPPVANAAGKPQQPIGEAP